MGDGQIARRLKELLADHSGESPDSLGPHSTPQNTPGWDSYANLSVMAAIEEEFAVTFSTRDALQLRSLGDLIAWVEQHAAAGRGG